ncbi:DUF3052 domain-containing protein [Dokdonella sp.]|uniref:DUF3052 domain-containing protein n=1 Tax=Dokdonella sp. TaxID=2291710 RepID=UPI002F4083C2
MSPATSGYSGKPAWQKLGLATEVRVLVRHAPSDYATLVDSEPGRLRLVGARAAFDLAHVFATTRAQLATELAALDARLPDDGTIWVSWPKKGSGVATDLVEDGVRELALPLGLVDVKVCAIDATWSGLKLVRRRERRGAR